MATSRTAMMYNHIPARSPSRRLTCDVILLEAALLQTFSSRWPPAVLDQLSHVVIDILMLPGLSISKKDYVGLRIELTSARVGETYRHETPNKIQGRC
ncbi:hypothetical protein F2P81_006129 [Scophthalmus maximus]|uniref:Uncharacterized protein n=1 Tax=Scophthalmus maximus TaxID=52904 RepID=A0A6A4T8D4_SCOMX|nr:hypothetical protein F2P81_006129 [Scophthalmus maximus]